MASQNWFRTTIGSNGFECGIRGNFKLSGDELKCHGITLIQYILFCINIIMKFAYVLFIALAAVAMSESLRPVPKVLKSPKYKFDRMGLGGAVMRSVRYLENQVRSVES